MIIYAGIIIDNMIIREEIFMCSISMNQLITQKMAPAATVPINSDAINDMSMRPRNSSNLVGFGSGGSVQ